MTEKTEPQSASEPSRDGQRKAAEEIAYVSQRLNYTKCADQYEAIIRKHVDAEIANLRAQLEAAQAEKDQLQASVEQLCGDVRACVADYNDEKRKRESAETQLRVARERVGTLEHWLRAVIAATIEGADDTQQRILNNALKAMEAK